VASVTFRPLLPAGRNYGLHWARGWLGLRTGLNVVAKREVLSCRESNPGRPARSLATALAELIIVISVTLVPDLTLAGYPD
jgi:hypothetical protein